MEIVLREPLNTSRRLNAGTTVDWDRPVITAVSNQLGRTDWFVPLGEYEAKQRQEAIGSRGKAKKG